MMMMLMIMRMMTAMVFGDDDNAEVDHNKKDIVHNKDLLKAFSNAKSWSN